MFTFQVYIAWGCFRNGLWEMNPQSLDQRSDAITKPTLSPFVLLFAKVIMPLVNNQKKMIKYLPELVSSLSRGC